MRTTSGTLNKYDKGFVYVVPLYDANYYYTDLDNGLDLSEQSVINVKPYIYLDGVKRYLVDGSGDYFEIDTFSNYIPYKLGVEVQVIVSYDATSVSDSSIATRFSYSTLNVVRNGIEFKVYGSNYISTGEAGIIDAVTDWFSGLSSQLATWKNALASQMSDWQSSLDNKLDDVIEAITSEYDTTDSDEALSDVDSTLSELDTEQKEVTENAVKSLDDFTIPADGFNSFDPQFIAAFGLVSSMMQSIYVSAGNFNIILSVVFMLTIATMCVGLFRYYKE